MGSPRDVCHAAGIQVLPPELLAEIFAFVADEDPLSLAQQLLVSRHWHEVATSSPRIWDRIILDGRTRPLSSLQTQAKRWIQRSAPLPFRAEITVDDINLLLPLLTPFYSHFDRWQACTFFWKDKVTELDLSQDARDINALGVTLRDPADFDPIDAQQPDPITYLPWISTHMVLPTVSKLPPPDQLFPHPLTELTVLETSQLGSARPIELLDFVSASSNITKLTLHFFAQDPRSSDLDPPTISLPSLTFLEIWNTFSPRLFLSRLHVPALTALRLGNLNVHFAVANPFAPEEDGDSDDEAGDFSQSPSSDKSIGMGLRNLLSRSAPPLEVLDMDYADMRTKDFRWCFDHLPYLRVFRIVGSDMSDSVINFLRPYYPDVLTEGVVASQRLRMPSLARLDLVGALRVSGDAVVAALAAREMYTRVTDGVARMDSLRIARCPGLDGSHDDALTRLFRGRIRVD